MLIWLGVDIFLGALAAPVIILIVVPGLVHAWGRHDFVYMIDVLLPNVILLIVPGAIVGGAYLLIASRVSRN